MKRMREATLVPPPPGGTSKKRKEKHITEEDDIPSGVHESRDWYRRSLDEIEPFDGTGWAYESTEGFDPSELEKHMLQRVEKEHGPLTETGDLTIGHVFTSRDGTYSVHVICREGQLVFHEVANESPQTFVEPLPAPTGEEFTELVKRVERLEQAKSNAKGGD